MCLFNFACEIRLEETYRVSSADGSANLVSFEGLHSTAVSSVFRDDDCRSAHRRLHLRLAIGTDSHRNGSADHRLWIFRNADAGVYPNLLHSVSNNGMHFFQFGKKMRDSELLEEAGKVASQAVDNIRTVHALNRQEQFHFMYCEYLKEPYR